LNAQAVVSWLLIGLAIVDWLATGVLVRAALHLREAALEERATTSVMLSIGATGAAVLAAAFLFGFHLPDGVSFLFIAGALVILSVPQLIWAIAYAAGRFR
jgi:hypothetical protein